MSDNVIRPAQFERGPRSGASQQRRREFQLAKLRDIEATIGRPSTGKKGYLLRNFADRIAAAREIGALVDEAKRIKNVSVAEVKRAMPGTTRLDRYKIEPGVSDSDARAKAERPNGLLMPVRGYLAAAEAVATLTGWDPSDLKIRVLSGTSLWSKPSASQTEEDPRASHLAMELKEMARSVIRRTKLDKLFERARRIPGEWDVANETFKRSRLAALYQTAYQDWFEHWSEAPPLPSVPLIRSVHALYHTFLRVEDDGRSDLLAGDMARQANFPGTEVAGWFELSREIRLAVGPVTSSEDVGAMFECRAHVTLWLVERMDDKLNPVPHQVSPCFTLKPVDDLRTWIGAPVFQVQINGRWHRVTTVGSLDEAECQVFRPGDDPKMWSGNPLDPPGSGVEHWYFFWNSINPESFAAWFDRSLNGTNTTVAVQEESSHADSSIWYAKGLVAHEVENALASGVLEHALEAAVAKFGDALAVREAEWREEAASVHAKRVAAWQVPENKAKDNENDD